MTKTIIKAYLRNGNKRDSVMISEAEIIARRIIIDVKNVNAKLGNEFYYASLPLCIVDAVFSIGVRYEGVQMTVKRFCEAINTTIFRSHGSAYPMREEQISVNDFVTFCTSFSIQDLTTKIFKNRQRTSTINGILKAQAVIEFARVLSNHNVQHFQDIECNLNNVELQNSIQNIKGQKSGIGFAYFLMLTGNDEIIKPDRMLLAFAQTTLERKCHIEELQELYSEVCQILKIDYPSLTPRMLDYQIWQYQRSLGAN